MEFLSDYIGGDISDEDSNDVFQVEYNDSVKVGAGEDYKSMEDFISRKLKLGAYDDSIFDGSNSDDDKKEEDDVIENAFESVDTDPELEIGVILGAFEEIEIDNVDNEILGIETIQGAIENNQTDNQISGSEDSENAKILKSELDDLLKKLE